MKKGIVVLLLILFLLIFTLFIIRAINPREIDDVSPEIPCAFEYLEKSDVIWVIPKFNNALNQEWCSFILSLNKIIGLHGVTHEFNEFELNRDQEYLNEGIKIFEECFGFKPTLFKPPILKINEQNKELIKDNQMKIKLRFNQITHKVYHCNDMGEFSNRFIDFF